MDRKKILVVDDEQVALTILAMRFKIAGFDVVTACDGAQALEKARTERPDAIILDVMLPKMNGFEVCRMLKFDDATRDVPVIFLSALHDQKERDRAVTAGGDEYYIKPFDLGMLIGKVKSYVGID